MLYFLKSMKDLEISVTHLMGPLLNASQIT